MKFAALRVAALGAADDAMTVTLSVTADNIKTSIAVKYKSSDVTFLRIPSVGAHYNNGAYL